MRYSKVLAEIEREKLCYGLDKCVSITSRSTEYSNGNLKLEKMDCPEDLLA